jgi:hypothetical protein
MIILINFFELGFYEVDTLARPPLGYHVRGDE